MFYSYSESDVRIQLTVGCIFRRKLKPDQRFIENEVCKKIGPNGNPKIAVIRNTNLSTHSLTSDDDANNCQEKTGYLKASNPSFYFHNDETNDTLSSERVVYHEVQVRDLPVPDSFTMEENFVRKYSCDILENPLEHVGFYSHSPINHSTENAIDGDEAMGPPIPARKTTPNSKEVAHNTDYSMIFHTPQDLLRLKRENTGKYSYKSSDSRKYYGDKFNKKRHTYCS